MQGPKECYVSPTLNSVGCSNLVDCMVFAIKKFKDAVAQINYGNNRTVTYKEIKSKSQQASYCLFKNGIQSGDVVAICSPNNIDYAWQILAILNCGATCALISPSSTPRELYHNLSITKPKAIIGTSLNDDQIRIIEEAETIKHVWLEETPALASKFKSHDELLQDTGMYNSEVVIQWSGLCPAEGNDAAFILSSSGSTGLPKGVVLSHNNLIAMLSYSGLFMRFGCTAVGLMPFYHAYGLGLMLMALYEGAKMVVLPKFSMDVFINIIPSYKVTHLHIVPSLLTTLAKNEYVTAKKLNSVQEVFTGAGAVITKHQQAILNKLPPTAKLYHSYGMTETTFVVMFAEHNFKKRGSAGKLLRGVSAKIVSKNGEELKGEIGELHLKGSLIMKGYLNNPEATSAAIDQCRWLHTGDLAYYDSDGYFYIVDRIKEMIKYQGFQISPTELELVLLTHPGVSEAAVIGVHHEVYGEVPKAHVVRSTSGTPVTEEELQKLIKEELSPYKQLRGGVCFHESLPSSPTGKIQRKYLKQ